MNNRQAALLWWKQMLQDLGSHANKHYPEPYQSQVKRRSDALVELYYALIDAAAAVRMIEIGAHFAETSRRFVASSPARVAFAYEANPSVFDRLLRESQEPRLKCFNLAVGSRSGNAVFYAPNDLGFEYLGSILERSDYKNTKKINVPMLTLDAIAEKEDIYGARRETVLWIDVEGATLDIIEGGRKFIKSEVAVIYCELNDFKNYEESDTALDVIETLLELGFIPVARDNEWPDAWNACFVHADLAKPCRKALMSWLYDEFRIVNTENHQSSTIPKG